MALMILMQNFTVPKTLSSVDCLKPMVDMYVSEIIYIYTHICIQEFTNE